MLRKADIELLAVFILNTNILKSGAGICSLCPLEFVVSEKKMGRFIIVALIAHHTPNLISRNGTACTSLGLSAACYLLFCVFTLRFK
jgi:hypothetical protein